MNKKLLGAAVLGILSTVGVSGQVHAMSTLDTVYVEADRISGNYPGGVCTPENEYGGTRKTGLYEYTDSGDIDYERIDR